MSAPALTFLAPPPMDFPWVDDTPVAAPAARDRAASPRAAAPADGVSMTRGARQAAAGMGITDADFRRCVEAPDDVTPDARNATRNRYRRGALTVLAAADGTVLRVERRGR